MDYTDDKNFGLKDDYSHNQYEQPRRPKSDDAASQNTRHNHPLDNQRRRNPVSRALGAFFGGIWRVIKCMFFGFSIIGNLVLLLIIMAIIAVGYSGYKGGGTFGKLRTAGGVNFNEYVITKGAVHQRIAVVEVANIITVETAEMVRQQFDVILEDSTVRTAWREKNNSDCCIYGWFGDFGRILYRRCLQPDYSRADNNHRFNRRCYANIHYEASF